MKKTLQKSLLYEEKRAVKWFLWLFYSIFFIYDIFYIYILPEFPWDIEVVKSTNISDYLLYVVMIVLLPLSIYFIKNNKPELIKYFYFLSYTILNLARELYFYLGNDFTYSSGNLVEIYMVLFSPIFVNKKFFYLVSLGTILKYLVVGVTIHDSVVMLPLLIVVVLSFIAYIILHRFYSYMNSVKRAYDDQLEGIVKGIITTLELKDPYTRGHSERVAEYALSLAKATEKYKKEELKFFYYACLLHDIGKIHIPDYILTKPGKLTADEYNLIKMHPAVGAKAVQDVEGISDNISVILSHHERWDGSGYPEGLKGTDIPFLARVTTIADAFDAMTSSRSYRSALSIEEAYTRILNGKGTQFDPELVELFTHVFPEWKEIHTNYYHSS
ncbi:HD-GYP domain-containing protein [Ornithinibacillus xuwenensis]|uniref:HD-GYP domain-containing protein n=1 Tax=Ornithinibacillus xuwenensis TaxID=3144668 RepID=A0ABU9XL87_9BACI